MHTTAAKTLRILAGVAAANLLGLACCALYAWLFKVVYAMPEGIARLLIATVYPNLLLVPLVMGIFAAFIWRPLELRIAQYLLCSLLTIVVMLGGAYLFMKEGVVCLLIVSPVLLGALFGGTMLGRVWFKRRPENLQLALFPLLIVVVLAEGRLSTERQSSVIDRVVIAAEPAEVWKHVVAFPKITAPPDHWLNKVGLPSAVETTCEGEFVGARRECIFSNGVVFNERVAELEREHLLTFDVVEQPNDPELLGHLTLHRGQFRLERNGDGTTTLIGRSWYTLHVRPLWYFDWWTRDITRAVHLRVMRHIKELSEQRA